MATPHIKAELGDFAETVLMPGDPLRAQHIAETFLSNVVRVNDVRNMFAYTGSVSLQAALNGAASVTTVDMSNTYLNWAQDNFTLNKLVSHKYQFIQADCLQWLKDFDATKSTPFDVIFIDPPTFSNSKRMEESFDVQRDYVSLITDALNALTAKGEIVFTNNKRNFKMDVEAMQSLGLTVKPMTELTRDKDFARNKHIHNSWSLIRH